MANLSKDLSQPEPEGDDSLGDSSFSRNPEEVAKIIEESQEDKYMLRVPSLAVDETGVKTIEGLAEDIISQRISYMRWAPWPPHYIWNGELTYDGHKPRKSYQPLVELGKDLVDQSLKTKAGFLVFRTNIPMNPEAGYREESGRWILHGRTQPPDGVPCIVFEDNGFYWVPDHSKIPKGRRALITSCLGRGDFEEDLFLDTTYDPRHLIDQEHKYPKEKDKWTSKEGLMTTAEEPGNVAIVRLAECFEDKETHRKVAGELINQYGWSRKLRTFIVVGSDREVLDCPTEFYQFDGYTAPQIYSEIKANTRIQDPAVFGLVEGGSFSIGIMNGGELHQKGLRLNRARKKKGMWLAYMRVPVSESFSELKF